MPVYGTASAITSTASVTGVRRAYHQWTTWRDPIWRPGPNAVLTQFPEPGRNSRPTPEEAPVRRPPARAGAGRAEDSRPTTAAPG
eukprot:9837255-Alexandrium_andersonii.AAC.1